MSRHAHISNTAHNHSDNISRFLATMRKQQACFDGDASCASARTMALQELCTSSMRAHNQYTLPDGAGLGKL